MVAIFFNLRCRSENEFNDKFHNQYKDFKCFMCKNAIYTQEHTLRFHVIKVNLTAEDKSVLTNIQYSDIFSDKEKQKNITNLYIHITQIRNKFNPTTGNSSEPNG